jgi:hypothetical protein
MAADEGTVLLPHIASRPGLSDHVFRRRRWCQSVSSLRYLQPEAASDSCPRLLVSSEGHGHN